MYINQIDNIIDGILDDLYVKHLSTDNIFNEITKGNIINFVEYRDAMNKFMQDYIKKINLIEIQEIINDKKNINKIIEIIKRYIAYYYFLSIAAHYKSTKENYRNNLLQYSKLQESSPFYIKNFFDTENNYQIINYFTMIKNIEKIITMTDLQQKIILTNTAEYKDAILFLENFDENFITSFFLSEALDKNNEIIKKVNYHNLIKTIVFLLIYRNQEQKFVFEILNNIEEDETQYEYIDIIVNDDNYDDYETFKDMFSGIKNPELSAQILYDLINRNTLVLTPKSLDLKNNNLIRLNFLSPIVDDFLKYHRDEDKIDVDNETSFLLKEKKLIKNNLYEQKKKVEVTKMKSILNKIDAVSELYSDIVKNDPVLLANIMKYFKNPLSYKKVIFHNYDEELHVLSKIINQGKISVENNDNFAELTFIVANAYLSFKDFKDYGTSLYTQKENSRNVPLGSVLLNPPVMFRYANIEFKDIMPTERLDLRLSCDDRQINIVGFVFYTNIYRSTNCMGKPDLLDIRTIKLNYYKDGSVLNYTNRNGFKCFLKLIKYAYVSTLKYDSKHNIIYCDYSEISKLNPQLDNKIIYWYYDIDIDSFSIDTFENIEKTNFQKVIKYMNSIIYDTVNIFLDQKLKSMISEYSYLSLNKIKDMIEQYKVINGMLIDDDHTNKLLGDYYFRKQKTGDISVTEIKKSKRIDVEYIIDKSKYVIKIDSEDPTNIQKYISQDTIGRSDTTDAIVEKQHKTCRHISDWKNLSKIKKENLNIYNQQLTEFISKYSIESVYGDYICRICGEVLPLKQFVQDGTYDNKTQKFVSAYVPIDIPLENIKEYTKYTKIINYMDGLINRVSMISGTNMLIGPNAKTKRKILVKNTIDIVTKHCQTNIKKKIKNDEKSIIYYFELEDNLFDILHNINDSTSIEILKYNNVLLYFSLVFITELNGSQIFMMNTDSIANIYSFKRVEKIIFDKYKIRKNIDDNEMVSIIKYPILCYLIFVISYFLVKYKLWVYQNQTNTFNPSQQKLVISSLIELFNQISEDTGKNKSDYIYSNISNKLYTQMNSTFKNNQLVSLLEEYHSKYAPKSNYEKQLLSKNVEENLSETNPNSLLKYEISFRPYTALVVGMLDHEKNTSYNRTFGFSDAYYCPYGCSHMWYCVNGAIECALCKEKAIEHNGLIDRQMEVYYFEMNRIYATRCPTGIPHKFKVMPNNSSVCELCGYNKVDEFSIEDYSELNLNLYYSDPNKKQYGGSKIIVAMLLDKFNNFVKNIPKIELDTLAKNIETNMINKNKAVVKKKNKKISDINKKIIDTKLQYKKLSEKISSYGNYDNLVNIINKFITLCKSLIGDNINLEQNNFSSPNTVPIYLDQDLYFVDHNHLGTRLKEKIFFKENDKRIMFKSAHTFFNADVYYYSDNKSGIDIYYDAITLKMLGYKENYKEPVMTNTNSYLVVSTSIYNKILMLGYESKYINVAKLMKCNDNKISATAKILIIENVDNMKTIIDNVLMIISKTKNYYNKISEDIMTADELTDEQNIESIASKNSSNIAKINISESLFDQWNETREFFVYKKIDFSKSIMNISSENYISFNTLAYYNYTSNILLGYVISNFIDIIDSDNDKLNKINLVHFFIEILSYNYKLFNKDFENNSIEIKRYDYIINSHSYVTDYSGRNQYDVFNELQDINVDLTSNVIDDEKAKDLNELNEEAAAYVEENDEDAENNEDYL
jgi:hypothetical protein